jgi:NAD+-dependent protein deacetylase sirtuin 5
MAEPNTVPNITTAMPLSSTQLSSFRQALSQAKRPIALAGAGLSAASGIPTFRGAGGLWRQHDAMSLATPEAFRADPSKNWQFYHYRREVCLNSEPNSAHHALARVLFDEQETKRVFPKAERGFSLITQK